jgi:hypothetical protein
LLTPLGWAKLQWVVLESEELDKHIIVLPSLWGTSCTVEQWWQKAYTLNTQFEHGLLCPLLWSILNMYLHTSQKCWEQQLDELDNKHSKQEVMAMKWVYQRKWHTYYPSHYCIGAMKQSNCVAKIQVTVYCNMANRSSFARYVLYHHKNDNWWLMLFVCIWCFDNWIYEYISNIHKNNTVELIFVSHIMIID